MAPEKRLPAYDPSISQGANTKVMKPDSKEPEEAVKDMMAAIYFDINCVSIFRDIIRSKPEDADLNWYRSECNKAGELIKGAAALLANEVSPFGDPIDKRIRELVEMVDWTVFAICAYSEAFRRACVEAEPLAWEMLVESIWENNCSVEVFARSRNLDWRGPLLTQTRYSLANLQAALGPMPQLSGEHPHHFVRTLNQGLRYPTFEGQMQTHIDNCIFDPTHWEQGKRDPTIRNQADGECYLCNRMDCQCALGSLAGNLVELVDYKKKGAGVRALANFKKGDILDQFVGEIRPEGYGDRVYGLEHPEHPEVPGHYKAVALISPKRFGNWTRFVNHSCDASTSFRVRTVGTHSIMTVEADRDISFGEEIVVDYGNEYWTEGRKCQCGVPSCRSNPFRGFF